MAGECIRTAVIGCGYLGRFHAQKYAQLPNNALVAVSDLDLSRAQAVADETDCTAYSNYLDFLEKVDAVSIVCTTSAHYKIAKHCLEAGKHVLIEKPMTTTLEQADEIIALAKEKGVTLQVGHLERFNGVIQELRPWVKSPRFISSIRLAPFNLRCSDVNVILDVMIHDIDLIQSMVDSPIKTIQATGDSVLSDFIDLANARIQFENGCVANVTASRINHRGQRMLHIAQNQSYADIDLQNGRIQLNTLSDKKKDGIQVIDRETRRIKKTDALLIEIEEFLDCITHQKQPQVDGHAGRAALETALKITQSIKQHNLEYPNTDIPA
jgi:predicted dehydrogenase